MTCEFQKGETATTHSNICLLKSAFKQKGGCLQFIYIPTPSASREEKCDAMHVTMAIIFLDLTILSFSEMVISIVKQLKKSIGYVLFCF